MAVAPSTTTVAPGRESAESIPGWLRTHWHVPVTVCLGAALWPGLLLTRLPLRFDVTIFQTYWIGLTLQSIFLGALLCAIGIPFEQGIGPWWRRAQTEKMRLALLLPLMAVFIFMFGPWKGALFCVDTVAILEFVDRTRAGRTRASILAVLLPAIYFFVGLLIVFGYNDLIAALRFNGSADLLLNRIDIWLLRGASVSSIARQTLAHLPARSPSWLSFVYFGMFPQLGAAVLLLGLRDGAEKAFRFVGTILVAYYIGLICFYVLPATGPYFLAHPASAGAAVYASENTIAARLSGIHERTAALVVGADYFIALPCMHLVQPLIVLWYLRRWKRIVMALAAYDCVLAAAILLLEQHYLVDLIAALAVAAVAVVLANERTSPSARTISEV